MIETTTRHAPWAQTKQVTQGETWVDCEAAGGDHDFVAHTTTVDAFYSVCSRCPVRIRTARYQAGFSTVGIALAVLLAFLAGTYVAHQLVLIGGALR